MHRVRDVTEKKCSGVEKNNEQEGAQQQGTAELNESKHWFLILEISTVSVFCYV